MTCREFKHAAASLTLWELARPRDEQLWDHTEECRKCGDWLDRQKMLAVSMQTLQARTAGHEAGPHVERALLRVFRQVPFEETQPVVARRSAPIAFRLSRFFEIGAYAAATAAIVVGLFLGVRLLERSPVAVPVQGQSTATSSTPLKPRQTAGNAMGDQRAMPSNQEVLHHSVPQGRSAQRLGGPGASQVNDDPDYVALMFCDPLICSSDAQVVRMELPAFAGSSDHDARTQVADVVVGDDGVVRAMRIVN